jgi:PmbA protein|tara:strand:+ start:74 stop:1405 length:1332 start_codon:yes stop_codon:yes gene_type:complete
MEFNNLANQIIEKTKAAGATDCDIVLAKATGKSVSCRLGKIEDIEESSDKTFGIRALIGSRQSFVSSSNFDTKNIDTLVTKVVEMAKLAPEDDTACLGDSSKLESEFAELDLCQNYETDTAIMVESVKKCEDQAISVKGISNSEGAGASYSTGEFFLATSHGFVGGYKSSSNSISCSVLAGEGLAMERDYDYAVARHHEDLTNPEEIGANAARLTLKRLNPRKVNSCKTSVVFDKRISSDIIRYVAGAISGNSITRGTSFLKDSLNKQIFRKDISIIDDPKITRGLKSSLFDGEGVRNQKTELVSNGVLKTWLLNTATAKKLNLKTTGHASRSVGSPPGTGTTNLFMANGMLSYDDLVGSINNGFYATELIGMGINLITGDYSMGASGFWIENGELAYPVSEVTIASNLTEMFLNLSAANDLEFKFGSNAPTICIEGMTLAGK